MADLLLALVDTLTAPAAPLEEIVRGDEANQPFERAVDVDLAPLWVLPWLACMVGVEWRGGTSEALRALIRDRPRYRRGTNAAIEAEVRQTLLDPDTATVTVQSRVGDDPFVMNVITIPAETPDPAATLAAINRVKPAFVLIANLVEDVVTIDADDDITISASNPSEIINN